MILMKTKDSGSWTVEYSYGNATNTKEHFRGILSYSAAIEKALDCFIYDGKYGWSESCREEVRAHLYRFGYFGDGNKCYEPRGLTKVEIYYEPTVRKWNGPLIETRDQN